MLSVQVWCKPHIPKTFSVQDIMCKLSKTTFKEQHFQLTAGESSAAFLLPFPDPSAPSSPAAIASMEAAMPALSLWENPPQEITINNDGFKTQA